MTSKLRMPRGALPFCFTAIVLAIFFLVLWLSPTVPPNSSARLVSELLRESKYVGSYDQRLAHLAAMIAVMILSAVGFVATRYPLVQFVGRDPVLRINIRICLLATFSGLLVYHAVVPPWLVNKALILAAVFFIFIFVAPNLRRDAVEVASLLATGAYLAIVIVPGWLTDPIPLIVSDPDSIAQAELHLLALAQPGSALAAGQSFLVELPFNYGLLMPSIMSVLDRRLGGLSVGDQARFVQYCQILFAFTAAAAYLRYRRGSYVGVLAALLLAAPYWASAGIGIWHPNQTGMRSLTLPLGILAMTLVGRFHPNSAAWVLGAVGGAALLINLETSMALGTGMLVYMILRTRSLALMPILRIAIAAIAVIVAYFVIYRFALGRLPFGRDPSDILQTLGQITAGEIGLRLFSAGSSKENYYIVPFALVMFVHAIYVVLAAFCRCGERSLSHLSALRAAIATILIVWLAYYFNLPNWWQIWTHLFLYGFLLIELLDPRLFAVGAASRGAAPVPLWRPMVSRVTRIVPIVFLALMIPSTNQHLLQFTRDFMFPPWMRGSHDALLVSGLLVPRAVGDALEEKSNKLLVLSRATGGSIIYLTYNVSFVPMLSRLFEPAPERSLWGSIQGDTAFAPVMNKILAKRPAVILIDAPTGPLAVTGTRKDFQERVREAVGRDYQLAETESGWQIWRPRVSQ